MNLERLENYNYVLNTIYNCATIEQLLGAGNILDEFCLLYSREEDSDYRTSLSINYYNHYFNNINKNITN